MRLSFFLLILLPCVLNPRPALSASANLDAEYDQVRKIALRDARVKAGFEKANQRLEEKILEIDPTLKNYVKGKTNSTATSNETGPRRKPFVQPSAVKAPGPMPGGNIQVIAAGDTLSGIAAHYKVTVADLKAANPGLDEKKLQVGKKVKIPAGAQRRAARTEPVKSI